MSIKHYVILSGNDRKIYTDLLAMKDILKSHKFPEYKSFDSKTEAENFVESMKTTQKPKSILPSLNKTLVYIDIHKTESNIYGYGLIIVKNNGDKKYVYGQIPINIFSDNNANLYVTYVVLSTIKEDMIIYTKTQELQDTINNYNENTLTDTYAITVQIIPKMVGRNINFGVYDEKMDMKKLAETGATCGQNMVILTTMP